MTIVADWQLATPSGHKPYEWQEAPFWAGLYELALQSSSRQKYLDAIRRNGESIQWQPGPGHFSPTTTPSPRATFSFIDSNMTPG